MAGTSGASAYVRLQKPDNNIDQAMQFWGGQQLKKNAEDETARERAGIRKTEQDEKDLKRYALDPEQYKAANAGFQDVNADNINYANMLVSDEADLMRQASDLKAKGDIRGAELVRNKALANRGNFQNRQTVLESHKQLFDAYQKDAQDNKTSGFNKGYENFYKATMMGGKVRTVKNKNGEYVTVTDYTDDNGETHRQINSDTDVTSGRWRYYLKKDLPADVKKISDNLGTMTKSGYRGYNNYKEMLWDGDGKGTQTKAAVSAIKALTGSTEYMSDMVDQFDLYDKMGMDRNNPPMDYKYSDAQKKMVADRIMEQVKGSYDQLISSEFNNAKYKEDQELKKPKPKTKEDVEKESLSKLRYDAQQAVQKGDYSVLLGDVQEGKDGEKQTVAKVVESPDKQTLILLDSAGNEIKRVTKSERGILEHKLGSSGGMYGKANVEQVMGIEPTAYQRETASASSITDAVAKQYSPADGKFIGSEEDFTKSLKRLYPDADIQAGNWTPFNNEIVVNGTTIDLDKLTKDQVESQVRKALGFKSAQAPANTKAAAKTKSDPLGLGI